eukprot:167859_1
MSTTDPDVGRRTSQVVNLDDFHLTKQHSLLESHTSAANADFYHYATFLKEVMDKIYGILYLTEIVYDTIMTSGFQDPYDILDDIEKGKSHSFTITKISKKISENANIGYEWTDEDDNHLYEILSMIYKDNIINIDRYNNKMFEVDAFQEKVIMMAKDINKTLRKPMSIPNLRELLQKENLNEAALRNITQDIMEQIAVKYDIKPHLAMKLLHQLRTEESSEHEVPETPALALETTNAVVCHANINKEKNSWYEGSHCEIYARVCGKWSQGQVTSVSKEQDGEWLIVHYTIGNSKKTKEIRGDSEFIRPISNSLVNDAHGLFKQQSASDLVSPIHKSSPQLKIVFDEEMMELLMNKFKKVLKEINHEIDAKRKFVYQIYHIQVREADDAKEDEFHDKNVRNCVTFRNEKAMNIYHEMQKERYPTVLLCNGSLVGSYGDRTRCTLCQNQAIKHYEVFKVFLHEELLDVSHILQECSSRYDQQRLLSMQRHDVIAQFTDAKSFNIPTLQIAMDVYDQLTAILKLETCTNIKKHPMNVVKSTYSDIMFLWMKKEPNIKTLDRVHFLYIVSLILKEIKTEKTFHKVDHDLIMRCLYDIQMNGLMFAKIARDVFTRSVVMHSQYSSDGVEVDAFNQLMECTTSLWDGISGFNLCTIKPSSICNVTLSVKDGIPNENNTHEPEDVPVFKHWMATFNSMYNWNTPFHFDIFAGLMKEYKQNKHTIIKIKYENYSTHSNNKTYDHVLKSFIAW